MTDLTARLRLTGEAGGWVAATDQGRAGMDRLAASEKKVEIGGHAVAGSLNSVGQAGVRAGSGLTTAASGGDRFERSARMAHSAGTLLGTTLAFLGGRELVRGISDAAFAVQGFDSGFKVTAGSAANAAAEIAFVTSEAERLGVPLRAAETGFMGLTASTMGTAVAGQRTRDVWVAMTEAGQVLHTGTVKQNLAMTAMAQIASKGVVSLEDLKGQLAESLPGALDVASEAMGVSRGELLKLVGEGKVLSDDFIPKFADALHNRFGPAVEAAMNTPLGKAQREMAATENALFSLQAAGGEAFLTGVTSGLAGMNAQLTDPEARAAARELGQELGQLVGTAAAGLGGLVDNIEAVTWAGKSLVAVGISAWLGTTASTAILAARALMTAAGATTFLGRAGVVATAGLSGLSSLMGGPLGIGILAATGGFLALKGAIDGSIEAAERGGAAYAESQQAAIGALERAIQFSDQYGISTVGLTGALQDVVTAGNAAGAAAVGKAGDDDRAANSARIRAEAERLLTLELINQAAQRARAEAGKQVTAAATLRTSAAAARFSARYDPTQSQDERDFINTTAADMANRATQASRSAANQYELSTLLSRQAEALRSAPLTGGTNAAPPPAATTTPAGSDKKTDAQKDAERRIETAQRMTLFAKAETEALIARSAAASKGEQALEDLRVVEAKLAAMQQLGVTSLKGLTGAELAAAEAAVAGAEAKERQAIATEKAERVAATLRDLDSRAGEERAYAEALKGGERALVDFAVAEQVRQEVERTGKTLSAEQVAAIRERIEGLTRLKAASEDLEDGRAMAEDLRLAAMTADEREREVRAITLRNRYLREDLTLTEAEADARARIVASYDQEAQRRAKDISTLKTQLRAAYIESGELGFDQVGEYAEKRLREAIYDALLAKPIDIVINAAVNIVGDIAGQVAGQVLGGLKGVGGQGQSGGLGSILGSLGGGSGGSILGTLGSAASGLGSLFGLGGGAAAVAGHAAASSGAAALAGHAAVSSAAGAGLMGSAGPLMAALGPIGLALGAVALIGSLVGKKESNHLARGTFAADGSFAVDGNKRTAQTNDAATAVGTSIQSIIASLKGLGINASGVIRGFGIGTRDASSLGLTNGQEIRTAKGDTAALVAAAAKALLQQGVYENPQMERVVDQMLAANRSFEEIAAKLDTFVAAQSFREDAKLELLRHTDQRAYTLAALEADQKARRDVAEGYGKDGLYTDAQLAEVRVTLDALDDAELAEALERLGDAATEAERAFQNSRDGYRQWLDRMTQSAAAPLNPGEQRQLAMAQYERVLEKARAHDPEAASSLTGYADRLISADLNATSSAQDRLALWTKVMADIEQLATPTAVTTQDAIAALTTANTQITLQASETIVSALTDTGGVVASIEDQTSAVTRALTALGDRIGAQLNDLAYTTGTGLAGVGVLSGNTLASIEALSGEIRVANAYARQVAARQ